MLTPIESCYVVVKWATCHKFSVMDTRRVCFVIIMMFGKLSVMELHPCVLMYDGLVS